ncbi:MAG: polysaccharide deacetylase family protein [Clostridiales bacterium]|jgi:polysaccharide deacetylase family sporulation protein PdaB|nr:polysaccharide deacetylase family protein [Clostridiales bacterium]
MFVTIKYKKIARALVVPVLLAASILALHDGTAAAAYFGRMKKLPIYSVETEKKQIGITFDAAWGADKTGEIVEILRQNGVRATFFLVGFWIEKYADEVKMLADAGIEIGNHSENHLDMAKLSAERIENELSSVNKRIEELTGKPPELFRPPFGSYNDRVITTAESLGLKTIQWDVDSLDWKDNKASSITDRVMKKVRNGSIILFHNNGDCVLGVISVLIPALKRRGYEFVTVGELIYKDGYYIDGTGRQIKE